MKMNRFLIRVLINAAALFLAVQVLQPYIVMQNNAWYAYLVLGLIFVEYDACRFWYES